MPAQAQNIRDLLYDRGSVTNSIGGTRKRFAPSMSWGQQLDSQSLGAAKQRDWAARMLGSGEYIDLCPAMVSPPLMDAVAVVMQGYVANVRTEANTSTPPGSYQTTQFGLWPRQTWGNARQSKITPRVIGVSTTDPGTSLIWNVPGFRLNRDPIEYLGVAALIEGLVSVQEPESENLRAAYTSLLQQRKAGHSPSSIINAFVKVSDELYFWLRFRGQAPGQAHDRLESDHFTQGQAERTWRKGFAGWFPKQDLVADIPSPDLAATLRDADSYDTFVTTRVVVASPAPQVQQEIPPVKTAFKGMQVFRVAMAISAGFHIRLLGPHATGKSLCATEAARITHESPGSTVGELVTVAGHESIQAADLLGTFVPGATKGEFAWVDGPLTQAMREGRPLFVDEGNRMPTKSFNVLQTAMSAKTVVLLDHGSEVVHAKDGFLVITAMNVGQAYAGVNHVDAAMESRFDATLMFDYLPEAEEVELLQEQTSIDKRLAEWMVAVATEIRSQYLNRQLSGDLTPRGLLAWAQMVQHVLAAAPAKANQITEVMTALPEWLWIPTVAGQDAHGRINRTHREAIQQIILNHKPQGI